jgi:CheY-like chemotaxis protein
MKGIRDPEPRAGNSGRRTECKEADRPISGTPSETRPGFRILLIDDMEPLLRILEKGLQRYGQTVFTASSGQEGLEIVKSHPIDAVVCDLGMPGMDGWSVAEAVQDYCREQGIPKISFILLTGLGASISHTARDLRQLGVDVVLEKPVEILALIQTVAEAVQNSLKEHGADGAEPTLGPI